MTSKKQIQANKINALKGGVKTSEGKAISKYNAATHNILRQSLTDYEEGRYDNLFNDLSKEMKPVGFIENMLVERIALCYIRLFRACKEEKEQIKAELEPTITKNLFPDMVEVVQEGYQPQLKAEAIDRLSKTVLRYERSAEKALYRAMHELQRLQTIRLDKINVIVPMAIDLDVSNE